ncbi:MAG: glycosyltransferase family 2 protein [Planctomycetota bacterium]
MTHPALSLCVITFNEERHIERCLRSVPFAADVVVLDSLSTDRTVEIARSCGARVVVEPFRGHVEQKARAVALAAHDWVLCLDADERLSADLAAAIPGRLERDAGRYQGYELCRHTFYLGAWINHGGWFPEWRLRLFDRRRGGWTGVDPHDRVAVDGPVSRITGGEIAHHAYRDLSHHIAKVNGYTTLMASRRHERGERFAWHKLLLHPLGRFVRMFVLRQGFRDGWRGFLLAVIAAFYVFLKYAKLLALERTAASDDR